MRLVHCRASQHSSASHHALNARSVGSPAWGLLLQSQSAQSQHPSTAPTSSVTLSSFSLQAMPSHITMFSEAQQRASYHLDSLAGAWESTCMEMSGKMHMHAIASWAQGVWQYLHACFSTWVQAIAPMWDSSMAFLTGGVSNTVPHAIVTAGGAIRATTASTVEAGCSTVQAGLQSASQLGSTCAEVARSGITVLSSGNGEVLPRALQTVSIQAVEAFPPSMVRNLKSNGLEDEPQPRTATCRL